MTKLLNEGSKKVDAQGAPMNGKYSYENVKRWGRKTSRQNIFQLDKVFFPINVNQSYWSLVVVFMQEKRIQVYDSFRSQYQNYLNHIFHYL